MRLAPKSHHERRSCVGALGVYRLENESAEGNSNTCQFSDSASDAVKEGGVTQILSQSSECLHKRFPTKTSK